MGMRGMMSLLSGMGQGYIADQDKQYDRSRQTKMDQIRLDAADREKQLFEQQQAERGELVDAGNPVTPVQEQVPVPAGEAPQARMVKPVTADNIDVGTDPSAAPMPSMSVAGRGGLNPAQATSEAAAANTPDAIQQRQLAVMQRLDPEKAARMQSSMLRAQADKISLATERWNSDVDKARSQGLDGILKLTDESHADGEAGAVKSKAVISPDGATFTIVRVMPDGTTQPTQMPPLPNSQEGIDRLAAALQRGVSPQARVAHYDQVQEKQQALDRQDRAEKANEEYRKGYLAVLGGKNVVAMEKAQGGGGRKADHFDEKEWDAANKIEPEFVSFEDPNGGKPAPQAELRLAYQTLLNEARAQGEMAPNEASEYAKTKLVQLKQKAQALSDASQASGKKITPQQAVQQILKAASAAPAPAPSPPAAPAAPAPKPASAASVPGMEAVKPSATPVDIPPPPDPMKRQVGINLVPTNPAYLEWQKKYGRAWAEKQQQEKDAAAAGASAAVRASRPFMQNRVPGS